MARAPGRPKEPALSRRVAVAAALAIIDRDGLGALNIRSLAAALEVNSASLYHHFENKDEILLGVARSVLRDVTVHDRPGEPWQTQMVSTLLALRRALLAHPNAVPLILRLHPRSFAPDPYNKVIDILERNGVPPGLTLTVLDAGEALTFGWALHSMYAASVETGPPDEGRRHGAGADLRAEPSRRRRPLRDGLPCADRRAHRRDRCLLATRSAPAPAGARPTLSAPARPNLRGHSSTPATGMSAMRSSS